MNVPKLHQAVNRTPVGADILERNSLGAGAASRPVIEGRAEIHCMVAGCPDRIRRLDAGLVESGSRKRHGNSPLARIVAENLQLRGQGSRGRRIKDKIDRPSFCSSRRDGVDTACEIDGSLCATLYGDDLEIRGRAEGDAILRNSQQCAT